MPGYGAIMMVIQHNLAAMNANRQLNIVTQTQAQAMEKLSSGYRVNRAADDAAGLSISEKMRRQIRGLTQASLNAKDGISMVQIADGAMAEVHDMLQRGNELAVKAANGTLSPEDRSYIQQELDQIKQEINAIQEKTTFNELYVLKGEGYIPSGQLIHTGTLPSWVGVDPASDSAGIMASTFVTQVEYTDINDVVKTTDIRHAATPIDFSGVNASNVNELVGNGFYCTCCTCDSHYSIRFTEGSGSSVEQSGMQYVYNIGIDGITNGADLVQAIINGADAGNPNNHYTMLAADPGNPATLMIYDDRSKDPENVTKPADWKAWGFWRKQQYDTEPRGGLGLFGKGVTTESDGNPIRSKLVLQIGSEGTPGNQMEIELPYIDTQTCHIADADLSTQDLALQAVGMFKEGIYFVSNERSRMGAYQNRLEHTVKNLDNVIENTTAAESQIRDTDMAKHMVLFSNYNILSQAGQSMLAQANQSQQAVLSLLGQ